MMTAKVVIKNKLRLLISCEDHFVGRSSIESTKLCDFSALNGKGIEKNRK
jgi:hypothetical protein